MEGQRSVDEEATDPLLDRSMNPCSEEDSEKKQSIHATPMVILSTFVAVLGSYVFGTAVSCTLSCSYPNPCSTGPLMKWILFFFSYN